MKIAITGSSGLVGSQLIPFLEGGGHEIIRVVRRRDTGENEVSWDPERETIDGAALEGVDALIHLDAGTTRKSDASSSRGWGPQSCSRRHWQGFRIRRK